MRPTYRIEREHWTHYWGEFGDHVSAELDLEVREAPLVVRVAERAHAVDDEAIVRDRRLEALLAVPCTTMSALLHILSQIRITYTSCYTQGRVVRNHYTPRTPREHSLLDRDPGALADEHKVREAVHNHRTLALLDHVREHAEHGRQAVVAVGEDVDV